MEAPEDTGTSRFLVNFLGVYQDLLKALRLEKPRNIYEFLAEYFENKIQEHDENDGIRRTGTKDRHQDLISMSSRTPDSSSLFYDEKFRTVNFVGSETEWAQNGNIETEIFTLSDVFGERLTQPSSSEAAMNDEEFQDCLEVFEGESIDNGEFCSSGDRTPERSLSSPEPAISQQPFIRRSSSHDGRSWGARCEVNEPPGRPTAIPVTRRNPVKLYWHLPSTADVSSIFKEPAFFDDKLHEKSEIVANGVGNKPLFDCGSIGICFENDEMERETTYSHSSCGSDSVGGGAQSNENLDSAKQAEIESNGAGTDDSSHGDLIAGTSEKLTKEATVLKIPGKKVDGHRIPVELEFPTDFDIVREEAEDAVGCSVRNTVCVQKAFTEPSEAVSDNFFTKTSEGSVMPNEATPVYNGNSVTGVNFYKYSEVALEEMLGEPEFSKAEEELDLVSSYPDSLGTCNEICSADTELSSTEEEVADPILVNQEFNTENLVCRWKVGEKPHGPISNDLEKSGFAIISNKNQGWDSMPRNVVLAENKKSVGLFVVQEVHLTPPKVNTNREENRASQKEVSEGGQTEADAVISDVQNDDSRTYEQSEREKCHGFPRISSIEGTKWFCASGRVNQQMDTTSDVPLNNSFLTGSEYSTVHSNSLEKSYSSFPDAVEISKIPIRVISRSYPVAEEIRGDENVPAMKLANDSCSRGSVKIHPFQLGERNSMSYHSSKKVEGRTDKLEEIDASCRPKLEPRHFSHPFSHANRRAKQKKLIVKRLDGDFLPLRKGKHCLQSINDLSRSHPLPFQVPRTQEISESPNTPKSNSDQTYAKRCQFDGNDAVLFSTNDDTERKSAESDNVHAPKMSTTRLAARQTSSASCTFQTSDQIASKDAEGQVVHWPNSQEATNGHGTVRPSRVEWCDDPKETATGRNRLLYSSTRGDGPFRNFEKFRPLDTSTPRAELSRRHRISCSARDTDQTQMTNAVTMASLRTGQSRTQRQEYLVTETPPAGSGQSVFIFSPMHFANSKTSSELPTTMLEADFGHNRAMEGLEGFSRFADASVVSKNTYTLSNRMSGCSVTGGCCLSYHRPERQVIDGTFSFAVDPLASSETEQVTPGHHCCLFRNKYIPVRAIADQRRSPRNSGSKQCDYLPSSKDKVPRSDFDGSRTFVPVNESCFSHVFGTVASNMSDKFDGNIHLSTKSNSGCHLRRMVDEATQSGVGESDARFLDSPRLIDGIHSDSPDSFKTVQSSLTVDSRDSWTQTVLTGGMNRQLIVPGRTGLRSYFMYRRLRQPEENLRELCTIS